MKKFLSLFMAACIMLALSACSQTDDPDTSDALSPNITQNANNNSVKDYQTAGGKILIAYFSYGENANLPNDVDASASASIQLLDGKVTGNTGLVANYIQKATGGDLFSIRTVKTYADSYNAVIDQGQAEKNNNEKPKISTHIENLDDYDTVFIGFPNWWYGMPMVMYSFFDEYDFSGKTIIPFCTSGGSAFSDSISDIKKAEPNATVMNGLHIGAANAADSEKEVADWVNGLFSAE